jgi:hypothetical protein
MIGRNVALWNNRSLNTKASEISTAIINFCSIVKILLWILQIVACHVCRVPRKASSTPEIKSALGMFAFFRTFCDDREEWKTGIPWWRSRRGVSWTLANICEHDRRAVLDGLDGCG